jgi:hypothetical protein
MGKLQATSSLHVDCPEKENTSSAPTCCNCQLAEGETARPSTVGAGGMQKKRCKKGSPKGHPRLQMEGFAIPTLPFAVALRGNSEPEKRPHLRQDSVAGLIDPETSKKEQKQEKGQSGIQM